MNADFEDIRRSVETLMAAVEPNDRVTVSHAITAYLISIPADKVHCAGEPTREQAIAAWNTRARVGEGEIYQMKKGEFTNYKDGNLCVSTTTDSIAKTDDDRRGLSMPNHSSYWNTGSDENLSRVASQNKSAAVRPEEAAFLLDEAQKLAQWDGVDRREQLRRKEMA